MVPTPTPPSPSTPPSPAPSPPPGTTASPDAPFEHTIRVRYAETDQMGVVYHAWYLVWMEEGRTRFMDALGLSYAEMERQGFGLAVHRAEVEYRSPALYDEEIVVRTRIDRVRAASMRFRYELDRAADGTRLANGVVDLACLDMRGADRKVAILPEAVRTAVGLAPRSEDGEGPGRPQAGRSP